MHMANNTSCAISDIDIVLRIVYRGSKLSLVRDHEHVPTILDAVNLLDNLHALGIPQPRTANISKPNRLSNCLDIAWFHPDTKEVRGALEDLFCYLAPRDIEGMEIRAIYVHFLPPFSGGVPSEKRADLHLSATIHDPSSSSRSSSSSPSSPRRRRKPHRLPTLYYNPFTSHRRHDQGVSSSKLHYTSRTPSLSPPWSSNREKFPANARIGLGRGMYAFSPPRTPSPGPRMSPPHRPRRVYESASPSGAGEPDILDYGVPSRGATPQRFLHGAGEAHTPYHTPPPSIGSDEHQDVSSEQMRSTAHRELLRPLSTIRPFLYLINRCQCTTDLPTLPP
ncbi:hypothetical protein OF83DRAFT_354351 [Amylostereum chailletii]|nr:hypothetical protein OF83DRAFT_354351 [Amylostereum chailletii]